MSNRILWILILLWFIFAWIWLYMYAFVYYNGNLTLQSNISDYSVTLESQNWVVDIKKECEDIFCIFPDLSPFSYSLIVEKSGYKTIRESLNIDRNESTIIEIVLEKEITLESVSLLNSDDANVNLESTDLWDDSDSQLTQQELALLREEKIEALKNQRQSYAYFTIPQFWEVFFKAAWTWLNLSITDQLGNNKVIQSFSTRPEKNTISVQAIEWDEETIFITYGEKKYLYHILTSTFQELDLEIDVKYVKVLTGKTYWFVTEKWVFMYELFWKKTFEYFTMFSDYIFIKGWYIWLIHSGDTSKKKLLGLDSANGNIIVFHNLFIIM